MTEDVFVRKHYRRKHGRADHGGMVSEHYRSGRKKEEEGWEEGKYEIHYHDDEEAGEHMHLKLKRPGDKEYESYVIPKEKLPDDDKVFFKYLGKASPQAVVGSRRRGMLASKGTFKEKDGTIKIQGKKIKLADTSYGDGSKNKLAIGLNKDKKQGKGDKMYGQAIDIGLLTREQDFTDLSKKEIEILADKLIEKTDPRSAWGMFHARAESFENEDEKSYEKMEYGRKYISQNHTW